MGRHGDSGGLGAGLLAHCRLDVAGRDAALSGLWRMKRYAAIYWVMLRNSLIREMSFKSNFLLWVIVELLWFVGQIVFIEVLLFMRHSPEF